jgi:hypothetical protein
MSTIYHALDETQLRKILIQLNLDFNKALGEDVLWVNTWEVRTEIRKVIQIIDVKTA